MNIIELMNADGRTKIARCQCGKGAMLAARMPMAESESDIIKDFKKCAKEGRRIEMMNRGDEWSFCGCENEKTPKPAPAAAVVEADPNQLTLFTA